MGLATRWRRAISSVDERTKGAAIGRCKLYDRHKQGGGKKGRCIGYEEDLFAAEQLYPEEIKVI